MTYLAPRPRCGFPIEMDSSQRLRSEVRPILGLTAQKIDHHRIVVAVRIAERPAGNRTNMLLELRHHAGIDGPVAGVVNARSDLVDENSFSSDEHLDTYDADIVELRGDRMGDVEGAPGSFRGYPGGHRRAPQNAVLMLVLGEIIGDEGVV